MLCGISDPFGSLSPTLRQVTHVLLTRLPLYLPLRAFAFDLHVLGTPPALILSQDQTLMLNGEPRPNRLPAPGAGNLVNARSLFEMALSTLFSSSSK